MGEFETLDLQNQQNLNSVNLEVETPNIQPPPTQNNQNSNLINQSNLPLQPLQLPPHQNQQLLQQPPQPPNLDPMAYAPIAKLDNFTGKEDDAQNDTRAMQAISYFLKDTANSWYQSLINKPQDFNVFKVEFLRYFSNNNSINCLVNTFTTMKQGETEAVTTYLKCFHRNLRQIQAIDANYFTVPQILNQFTHGLCSSILQHVRPLHSDTLQNAVTCAKDFESAESEANHAQAINLVMNKSSELNSKLKQFSNSINQKLEGYLADNSIQETTIIPKIKHISQHWPISSGSQRRMSATTVKPRLPISNSEISTKLGTISKHLPANNTAANLPSTSISDSSLSTTATSNISTTATCNISTTATNNLSTPINSDTAPKFIVYQLIPSSFNSPSELCSRNSGTTTVTNDKLLVAIFPFDLKETIKILLFSRAALEEKPITAMYMNAKIDGHTIKLILDSESAGSIITKQLMDQLADGAIKTPIGKIDNLPIEINGIMVPIKIFVMEATQYQALVGNNWLSKTHATLDWTTQELQLTFGGQHTQTPATCGHFKPSNAQPFIEFEKKTRKLTWEVYQVSWANKDHNKLPPIFSWDDKGKGKENKELIWKTDQNWETDNDQDEPAN
ncbi:hypothetical protein G9A89_000019 [Geosiphon pyriformis]|nr:hypothetical protein G9A89_000019 [Geosiphon pyriformis]